MWNVRTCKYKINHKKNTFYIKLYPQPVTMTTIMHRLNMRARMWPMIMIIAKPIKQQVYCSNWVYQMRYSSTMTHCCCDVGPPATLAQHGAIVSGFLGREWVYAVNSFSSCQLQDRLRRVFLFLIIMLSLPGTSPCPHAPHSILFYLDRRITHGYCSMLSLAMRYFCKNHTVPLDMKGCICHLTKWQIHPFISKGTNYLLSQRLASTCYVTHWKYHCVKDLIMHFGIMLCHNYLINWYLSQIILLFSVVWVEYYTWAPRFYADWNAGSIFYRRHVCSMHVFFSW